jgi:hypothetical protein
MRLLQIRTVVEFRKTQLISSALANYSSNIVLKEFAFIMSAMMLRIKQAPITWPPMAVQTRGAADAES